MENMYAFPYAVQINVKNMTESIGFYARLGFKIMNVISTSFYEEVALQVPDSGIQVLLCRYFNQKCIPKEKMSLKSLPGSDLENTLEDFIKSNQIYFNMKRRTLWQSDVCYNNEVLLYDPNGVPLIVTDFEEYID